MDDLFAFCQCSQLQNLEEWLIPRDQSILSNGCVFILVDLSAVISNKNKRSICHETTFFGERRSYSA